MLEGETHTYPIGKIKIVHWKATKILICSLLEIVQDYCTLGKLTQVSLPQIFNWACRFYKM